MPQRVQTLRSSTKLQRPTAGTREPGELYVSFTDLQLGVINAAKSPQDLIAVRFFSAATDYAIGSFVINAGVGYRAKVAVTAGAFNVSQWDTLSTSVDLSSKENTIVPGTVADYWRGDKTWVPLVKSSVGLGNVDNTSDANKPISNATQTALNAKIDRAGDTMSGHLVLPSGPGNTNAVRKDYVDSADTTLNAAIGLKAPIASPTFTGDPKAPTPSPGDNDTSIATTAFVTNAVSTGTTGKIDEAPIDGIQYVRQSAAWAPVSVPPGTAVSDAAPSSPANGQLWWESDSGNMYIYYNDGSSQQWVQVNAAVPPGSTAQARNRIVNGAMQVSQENGNTTGTTNDYFVADQWATVKVATGTIAAARVQVTTPKGSLYRFRLGVNSITASPAAGDILSFGQKLEGSRMADFMWGTASARQAVLRFGFKGPAGTYSAAIYNGAGNRSYIANFTVTAGQANTDTEQTMIIPGDTTGTWPTDTTAFGTLVICVMGGSSYQGVLGWQVGLKETVAGNTNGMAAVQNFELFDVGLYMDPLATGIAPAWAMPDEAQELTACKRYYFKLVANILGYGGNVGQGVGQQFGHSVAMRTTPAMSASGGTYTNASSITFNPVNADGARVYIAAAAAGQALYDNFTMVANARM